MGDLPLDNPSVPHRITQCVISKPHEKGETTVSNFSSVSSVNTLRRGNMLGIVRPYWYKVTESEQRMLTQNLSGKS